MMPQESDWLSSVLPIIVPGEFASAYARSSFTKPMNGLVGCGTEAQVRGWHWRLAKNAYSRFLARQWRKQSGEFP